MNAALIRVGPEVDRSRIANVGHMSSQDNQAMHVGSHMVVSIASCNIPRSNHNSERSCGYIDVSVGAMNLTTSTPLRMLRLYVYRWELVVYYACDSSLTVYYRRRTTCTVYVPTVGTYSC